MAELTSNEQFSDALIRHQTYLIRHAGAIRNAMIEALNESEQAMANIILSRLTDKTGLVTEADLKRLQSVLRAVDKARLEGWANANQILLDSMLALGEAEPLFAQQATNAVLPVVILTTLPSKRAVNALIKDVPIQGRTLKQWGVKLAADDIVKVNDAITTGMAETQSSRTIAKRVLGAASVQGRDGVTHAGRIAIGAAALTAVQHTASFARREFYLANEWAFRKEKFQAVLDSRTTPICYDNDNKVYAFGVGPQPPLHIRCRSLRIPWFDGIELGDRPMTAFTEKRLLTEYTDQKGIPFVSSRAELPYGTKTNFDQFRRKRIRQLIGTEPQSVDYEDFLRRQPVVFQEEVLGVTKTKLFRTGKISIHKFVARDGTELTLSQIANRNSQVFEAAGLDPNKF